MDSKTSNPATETKLLSNEELVAICERSEARRKFWGTMHQGHSIEHGQGKHDENGPCPRCWAQDDHDLLVAIERLRPKAAAWDAHIAELTRVTEIFVKPIQAGAQVSK